VALFGGGADGTQLPARFISAATRLLKSGGFIALEHDETQSASMAKLLSANFSEINGIADLTGRPRFTTAIKR
jgi:release factor glutamine methyltransferase